MFSWSDPNPNNATSAALSSQYKVDAAQIGAVVAAIMASRDRNAALQQQQQQFQQQQAQNAIHDFNTQQRQSQADDAANAAIYGSQYPNDQYGGYTNPDKVPDYGGVPAWQATQKQIADQIAQERVDAYMHKAYGGGGGSDTGNDYGPQITTDDQGREWRQGSGGRWYPIKTPRTPNDEPPADFPDAVTGQDMYNLARSRRGNGVNQEDINQAMQAPDLPPDNSQSQNLPKPPPLLQKDSQYGDNIPKAPSNEVAPSRDAAEPGQRYVAPDGSIRIKQG